MPHSSMYNSFPTFLNKKKPRNLENMNQLKWCSSIIYGIYFFAEGIAPVALLGYHPFPPCFWALTLGFTGHGLTGRLKSTMRAEDSKSAGDGERWPESRGSFLPKWPKVLGNSIVQILGWNSWWPLFFVFGTVTVVGWLVGWCFKILRIPYQKKQAKHRFHPVSRCARRVKSRAFMYAWP